MSYISQISPKPKITPQQLMSSCITTIQMDTNMSTLTSPVLDTAQLAEVVGHKGRDILQVVRPHPCGQQRLMGIPESGIRE